MQTPWDFWERKTYACCKSTLLDFGWEGIYVAVSRKRRMRLLKMSVILVLFCVDCDGWWARWWRWLCPSFRRRIWVCCMFRLCVLQCVFRGHMLGRVSFLISDFTASVCMCVFTCLIWCMGFVWTPPPVGLVFWFRTFGRASIEWVVLNNVTSISNTRIGSKSWAAVGSTWFHIFKRWD